MNTLETLLQGDTGYIGKHNSNYANLKSAIDALELNAQGQISTITTTSAAFQAQFGARTAVLGSASYKATISGTNLTIAAGYCWLYSSLAIVQSISPQSLPFVGLTAGTYYVMVDVSGGPSKSTTAGADDLWSVVWNGSALSSLTRIAPIIWGSADIIAAQTSSAMSHTYETLDARFEAVEAAAAGAGTGSVTSVSVVSANGVSGTVSNPTTTPAITLDLGDITPDSVSASGNVTGLNLSGVNTGDQTISLTDITTHDVSITQHGFAPKAPNDATKFLDGLGGYSVPPGTNTATVTSVGLSLPAEFTVSNSPVTGAGTLTAVKATQAKNTVWAGPTSGADAAPAFRVLDYADLPAGVGPGKPRVQSVAYAASVTLDCSLYDVFKITLTGNLTLDFSGAVDGQKIEVRLTQDDTGSRTVTWSGSVAFGSDLTSSGSTASTGAGKRDKYGFEYDSGATKYDLISCARSY